MKIRNKGILQKISIITYLLFFCLAGFYSPVHGAGTAKSEVKTEDEIIKEQIETEEIQEIKRQLEEISSDELEEIIPDYDPSKMIEDLAKGNFEFDMPDIFNKILKFLFKELYLNMDILIKVIVLAVICAILKNLQASFLSEGVGEIAFFTCYVVIVSILLISFNSALNVGKQAIDSVVAFMHSTIPILITLLVSSGNLSSGGIFEPILIMVVEISGTLIKNLFIPLIFLSTVLSIVDNISEKVQITKLTGFLKQISGWALGFILTIFIGVVSLQGALGGVIDGVTTKTVKFAVSTFIPVAGKYLADASETVLGCTLLIKNATGVVVLIGIITICIVPFLKIVSLLLIYKLTAVILEPISEKRITNCINQMAGSLGFVTGIVAAVSIMFLITVTVIIGASNISAMVR